MRNPRQESLRSKRAAASRARGDVQARALGDFDTQLMLQARAGHAEAANALIRRNFERIARYITRLVGRHRPVEDLTQDVFLRAFSHANSYSPDAKVTTWLYRIATNVALNHLKQPDVKRRVAEPAEGAVETADPNTPPPDRRLNLAETKAKVIEAVNRLPLNQRVALTLFQYEDCTYEQIAAVLDVSVEAVRSLLMRARTTLRRELRELL